MGQDALHVYQRLIGCLELSSVDAVLAVRALRKWLGSLNPTVRRGQEPHELSPPWEHQLHASKKTAADLRQALHEYFQGNPVPANAAQMLEASLGQTIQHPATGCAIPRPVLVVLLEDFLRAAHRGTSGYNVQDASAAAYQAVYRSEEQPCVRKALPQTCRALLTCFRTTSSPQGFSPTTPNFTRSKCAS